jgi:hypothetical protein
MAAVTVTMTNAWQVPADGQCRSYLPLGPAKFTVGSNPVDTTSSMGSGNVQELSVRTSVGGTLNKPETSINQVYVDSSGNLQAQVVTQANKTVFPANSVAIALMLVDAVGRIHDVDDYRGSDGNISAPVILKSGKTI